MSFFHAQQSVFHAAGGTIPFVSDIVIVHSTGAGAANAGIHFNYPTGGVATEDARVLTKRHLSTYTDMGLDDAVVPVDHTGQWTSDIITPADWEVACISEDIGTWDLPGEVLGVYRLLSVLGTITNGWRERRAGGKGASPGTNRCVATFRIREVAVPSNFTDFEVDASAIQT